MIHTRGLRRTFRTKAAEVVTVTLATRRFGQAAA